jgi:formylglycine-generating enzyme required for sulfatase activity
LYSRTTRLSILLLATACANSALEEFSDCAACPIMIELPAGNFRMGTADEDRIPDPKTGKLNVNESPQHVVTFPEPFAIGKYEVTVEQFAEFADSTGYVASGGCIGSTGGNALKLRIDPNLDWRNPGFEQAATEPVVCVSYTDARAYAAWLTRTTGNRYDLPTEAQWEYATRGGSDDRYFWGNDPKLACKYANVRGPRPGKAMDTAAELAVCDDGQAGIAPVGNYQANPFGIHDALGNVWEWVMDCSHPNYDGAPTDGGAWVDEADCVFRIIRGGSYSNPIVRSGSAIRAGRPGTGKAPNLGFRVARMPGNSSGASQASAGQSEKLPLTGTDGELFAKHCAPCHAYANTFKGDYGTDADSVRNVIRNGGNNNMSMPGFGAMLNDEQIDELTAYIRTHMGWE